LAGWSRCIVRRMVCAGTGYSQLKEEATCERIEPNGSPSHSDPHAHGRRRFWRVMAELGQTIATADRIVYGFLSHLLGEPERDCVGSAGFCPRCLSKRRSAADSAADDRRGERDPMVHRPGRPQRSPRTP
jgi:hypothetical protein